MNINNILVYDVGIKNNELHKNSHHGLLGCTRVTRNPFSLVKMKLCTAIVIVALAMSMASAEDGTPPWDSLSSALSSPSILLTEPTSNAFVSECAETFLTDPTMTNPTPEAEGEYFGPPYALQEGNTWMMLDQPSKLCTQILTCAFKDCYYPDLLMPGDNADEIFTDTVGALEQSKEHLAFPVRVVQPVSVGDVVATMKWAYKHKVPVSVKTSGVNWGGASAGGGTLSINTRSLPAYAMRSADSIHECNESGTEVDPPACGLALARGKTAIIRVGGGEVWDAVLQAIIVYNDDPANADGKKYMIVSGSSGTVAPAGGWLASGGMAGMRMMREYGFGVDQVLQMEVRYVLAELSAAWILQFYHACIIALYVVHLLQSYHMSWNQCNEWVWYVCNWLFVSFAVSQKSHTLPLVS